ncbi:winged helix-turn-helix domain-containing protein [Gorillibacterium massiliense]|uniref:winged helix-turn-helix domain-containing protein n=1 Tax=Gorillibacterium massiliense TaxID=1280390 RepID=UPI0004B9703A|nr:winged helix-turn-helix domain-containing protein [Gorillibacterium massiliense]
MNRIRFEPGNWTVAWGGQAVVLLPKEYTLLAYLYRHAGRTLTREQLLDGVWPLEAPTDRTVDDHIYRLRKKLLGWRSVLRIETVRGAGYRLVAEDSAIGSGTEPVAGDNPLLQADDFKKEMQGITQAYIRYGRGDALLALARNKELFGYEMEPAYQLLIRLNEGDVRFLLDETAAPFRERLFFLLLLYHELNPRGSRPYVEAAIRANALPPLWQRELETMILPSVRLDWGEAEKAAEGMERLAEMVERNNWQGLIPYVGNMRLKFELYRGEPAGIQEALNRAESLLNTYPYQREMGQFYVCKGLAAYGDDPQEGRHWIERGLAVLQESHFLPHLLLGIRMAAEYAERRDWRELASEYRSRWTRTTREIGLAQMESELILQLRKGLGFL